ncbi:MAG: glycosyltransferase family 4 protein, partial [Candidatus Cloacimonetes bacterium]|nr:glycosyltransferase family 4 protein [Candidatus Cloacimonadota bacterium]
YNDPKGEYHDYIKIIRPLYLLNIIKYRHLVIPRLKKVIGKLNPDIIHVHDCRHVPELVNLAPLLSNSGLPHYLTVHNMATHPVRIKNMLSRMIYRFLLPIAYKGWDHIFCVNNQLIQQISAITQTHNISMIGNAIQPCSSVSDPLIDKVVSFLEGAEFKIISAGNLKATKGFDLLIEAVAKIVSDGIPIRLAIFGDGDQRASLDRLIMDKGLKNAICCFGGVENSILRNLYPLFNAFILPSYSETFGIVYLEAMAAGIVTVGVRGQGIDGVIKHGDNGLLVDPKSIESIEQQIRWIISHPTEAKNIAQEGKILVDRDFRLEQLCDRIMSVYEKR